MSYSTEDLAKRPGMQLDQLERFLDDVRLQPTWRYEADRSCDYYDGHQLGNDQLRRMEILGIPPLITNLIKPTVDVVLGMEARTRSDPRVAADTDEWQEVAEAQSVKLLEAKRESNADMAVSDAYASQVKAGIGWVFVGRQFDPFRYQYAVEDVPRGEIWWDWNARRKDLSDARYLVRRKWYDLDLLESVFHKHRELLKNLVGRWSRPNWDMEVIRDMSFAQSWDQIRSSRIDQSEWIDSERDRLCLYEVWYRIFKRGHVVRLPNGRVVEVDVKNKRHAQMILSNMVTPTPAVFSRVRLSWWVGPFRLEDVEVEENHFPYVPFWGFREDRSGIPYGLIRTMMSPQDEVNARSAKMMWMLSAKRVVSSKNAVADPDRARKEIARPDAWVELSSNFDKTKQVFEVQDDFQLAEQQFQVMMERKRAISESAGVYQVMQGDPKAASSGIMVDSLVEQGMTTLAEINDNYRFARRLVYEYLLELVTQDMKADELTVHVNQPGRPKKTIVLNQPAEDELGEYRENDVQRALTKVGLEDVPSTPAYRKQMFLMLGELTKGLPPQLQAFVVPFIIRASDLADRHNIADTISKAMGMEAGDTPADPRTMQMQEENAALQDLAQKLNAALVEAEQALKSKDGEAQARAKELDLKTQELDLRRRESEAKAEESRAKAEREAKQADMEAAEKAMALVQQLTGQGPGQEQQQAGAPAEKPEARVEKVVNTNAEKLRKEFMGQIDKVMKAVEAVAKDDKSEKVEARLADQIKELRQTTTEMLKALKEKPKSEDERPIVVNVPVTIEAPQAGSKKVGELKKAPDGKGGFVYRMEVEEKRAE